MSLYDDASLIAYPSGYKESKIYAQKPIDGTGDLTFARASSATRVNEQGLIETPSVLGSELAVNGDFATDTDWTKTEPSTMSISGGKAIFASTTSNQYFTSINFAMTVGKVYVVEYTISDYVSGGVYLQRPFDTSSDVSSANGTYKFTLVATQTSVRIRTTGNWPYPLHTLKIDNVSVKEVITSNIPRIDYTGGGCGSLLLEPQRTNLITESQDFSGNWSTSAVTINSNAATSPDGATNASKVTPTTSTSVKYISTTAAVVSGVDYTFSFFAKAGGYDYVSTYISALGITGGNWNLATGVATGTGKSMEDYGNGWWRCTATGTSTGTSASCRIYSHPTASTSFTGNGVDGVYVYGAQVEAGSYPTSYIPTSGTTVTRVADSSSTTGLSSVINSEEGVLYAEISALANDGTTRAISISDGTSNNRLVIFYDTTSNKVNVFAKVSNTNQAIMNFIVTDATSLNKIAVKYKLNDYSLWINGVEVDTDISATTFTSSTLTTLSFADGNTTSSPFYGNVQNLMVFPSALDDATLATLTTL